MTTTSDLRLPSRKDVAETMCFLARHGSEHPDHPSCPANRHEADHFVRALEARYAAREAATPADTGLPDELRRLSEAATPGPWKARSRAAGVDDDPDSPLAEGPVSRFLGWDVEPLADAERGMFASGHDAAFIASAANYVRELAAGDTGLPDLDAAWREAEAALPDGWELILRCNFTGPGTYVAIGAELPTTESRSRGKAYIDSVSGPTPAAALHELARRLSGPHDGEEGAA